MKVRRVKVNEGVQQQRAFCVRRRKLKGGLELGAEFIEFWGTVGTGLEFQGLFLNFTQKGFP